MLMQPNNAEMIPQGDERKLLVTFKLHAIKNNSKSTAEGRPIFDDKVFVEIIAPGNKNSVTFREAKDADRERFPAAWQRFERGQATVAHGTPLEQWPLLTVGDVASLKAMNVHTVEHLAELPDGVADQYMGFRTYRAKAIAYLKAAADGSHVSKMQGEIEKLTDENARLAAKVDELIALVDKATAPAARRAKLEAAA